MQRISLDFSKENPLLLLMLMLKTEKNRSFKCKRLSSWGGEFDHGQVFSEMKYFRVSGRGYVIFLGIMKSMGLKLKSTRGFVIKRKIIRGPRFKEKTDIRAIVYRILL